MTQYSSDNYEVDKANLDPTALQDKGLQSYFPFIAMVSISALIAQVMHVQYNLSFTIQFMGILLILFSLVKFFDLDAFVVRFAEYDYISARTKIYAFFFPLIELMLGLSYLGAYNPRLTSYALFVVGVVSTLGLVVNFKHRNRLYTASMGNISKMPFTTLTLLENALMIGMGLFYIINRT